MSADFSSYLFIGLPIDKSKLVTVEKVKAFYHEFPEEYRVSPIDGKPLWKINHIPITGYDDSNDKLFDYDVICTDEEQYFICFKKYEADSENEFVKLSDTEINKFTDIKKTMKECLEPLGLWVEDKFGIYSILNCSY